MAISLPGTKTPPAITLSSTAELLGISKSSAYRAIKNDTFPVPTIRIGGRVVVPTKPLLELLGLDELPQEAA